MVKTEHQNIQIIFENIRRLMNKLGVDSSVRKKILEESYDLPTEEKLMNNQLEEINTESKVESEMENKSIVDENERDVEENTKEQIDENNLIEGKVNDTMVESVENNFITDTKKINDTI